MKTKTFLTAILFMIMPVLLISPVLAGSLILRPNAQGAYTGWTNVGCSSGSEWQCVASTELTSYKTTI